MTKAVAKHIGGEVMALLHAENKKVQSLVMMVGKESGSEEAVDLLLKDAPDDELETLGEFEASKVEGKIDELALKIIQFHLPNLFRIEADVIRLCQVPP